MKQSKFTANSKRSGKRRAKHRNESIRDFSSSDRSRCELASTTLTRLNRLRCSSSDPSSECRSVEDDHRQDEDDRQDRLDDCGTDWKSTYKRLSTMDYSESDAGLLLKYMLH
ncbi:unnamed protein product [Caenorhabditis sp. 36 PRJEB53466]|nr:unnamed protein product [Caenorhabditis sp. 36 PRJEB53466]